MAATPLLAPIPIYTLEAGNTITVEAIDPTTGAAVTGVTVSQVTIYADNAAYTASPTERTPLFALEPLE